MQSHGKSSTLESITHISLPQGNGTKTICPIKISLRNSKGEEYARIKFENEPEENYEFIERLEDISDKVSEFQERVKRENNVDASTVKLFDRTIQVEVNRRNAPNLTLYDLPGLNFNRDIKEDSKKINKKYLEENETTVLLVMSASEEISNTYVTEWIESIPNYKERFIPVITKAEFLIEKDLSLYMNQIEKLGLKNNVSLIVNRYGRYSNLSYEEMKKKEIEIINSIPNIKDYPKINKGIDELINVLIEIQAKDLEKTFMNIGFKINNMIEENEWKLKKFPRKCKSKEEAAFELDQNIREFYKTLKMEMGNFSGSIGGEIGKEIEKEIGIGEGNGEMTDNGSTNQIKRKNLIKHIIKLKYIDYTKNLKIKMNDLLTEASCKEVTKQIVENNSNNLLILEDSVDFNSLIKPKIDDILRGSDVIIMDVYKLMCDQIKPIINISFENYQTLRTEFRKYFDEYALQLYEEVHEFYTKLKELQTCIIFTYNNMELISKVNYLNKEIINFLFSNDKIDDGNYRSEEEDVRDRNRDRNGQSEKKKNSVNLSLSKNNVENLFQEITSNINSLIQITSNYKREKKDRKVESNEYTGRIKIAHRPQDISAYDERLNPQNERKVEEEWVTVGQDLTEDEWVKIGQQPRDKKESEREYEFIPGFQYIGKRELTRFKMLIKDGTVELKAANVITKMMAYLEIMINRFIDILFSKINLQLYVKLTDENMIDYIRRKLNNQLYDENKDLMEISPEVTREREKYENILEKLRVAKEKIESLDSIKYKI